MPKLSRPVAKGTARIVYYVFRDKMHRVLTVLQKLPSPCRAKEWH